VTDELGLTLKARTDTVLRMIDLDAVEFDEAGKATNLIDLLKALYQSEPTFAQAKAKRPGSADGGATESTRPVDPGPGMPRLRFAYANSKPRR
jgi:hypothetical protein